VKWFILAEYGYREDFVNTAVNWGWDRVAGFCVHGSERRMGCSGRILWTRQWTEDGVEWQDFVFTASELRMGYSGRILCTRQWTEDGVILLTNKFYYLIRKHMHCFPCRSKWLQPMHPYRWASRCFCVCVCVCVVYLRSVLVLSFQYAYMMQVVSAIHVLVTKLCMCVLLN